MSLRAEIGALGRKRLFVPEVLQTSMMDCGPATLKSVFDGFRRPINLERLRERCQTDVDGTSLSAMHDAAQRLGLRVLQIMVPKDSLLMPEASSLPAIVFLVNPDGLLHFVTVWGKIGRHAQIMDPSRGRVWLHERELLARVATPTLHLPVNRWRAWAGGPDFGVPLVAKMTGLGIARRDAERLLASANEDKTPRSLAALDAAARMVRSLVAARALPRGAPAHELLTGAFTGDRATDSPSIPRPYWICSPGRSPNEVAATGAVLLSIEGVEPDAAVFAPPVVPATGYDSRIIRTRLSAGDVVSSHAPATGRDTSLAIRGTRAGEDAARMSIWAGPVVPKEILDELRSPSVRPLQIFVRMLWEDSRIAMVMIGGLLVLAMGTSVLDALLMRGLADLVGRMNLVAHRIAAIVAVALFLLLALVFDFAQAHLVQRLARGLEARLRVAFLEKLPRLPDHYFRSRPISDMASRAHVLSTLRAIPRFAVDFGGGVLRIVTTTGVLVWLEPRLWKLAVALLVVCLSVPAIVHRLLDEATARLRVLGATLFRFYLDALLGVIPVRVHGAERSVRREHEAILTEWVRSGLAVETRTVAVKAFERILGTLVAVAIVVVFVQSGGDLRALLLVAFFAQRLPTEAEALVNVMRRYPLMKHDALRLFEPLAASETERVTLGQRGRAKEVTGVDIAFRSVTAAAGGRPVITDIDLSIARGTHVAVVGPSGAGKSSLVGVLLGWLFVTEGRVLIDGRPLDTQRLARLREETAWVDPAVQLWNATLLENLLYGSGDEGVLELERALEAADLLDVVERLPDGLQSALGESGARVSGGQGQRVRFGRALLKRNARLVILDEPFRGLERDKRRDLLRRARLIWQRATILFVSHDVSGTLEMDRVVVVENGAVVENGSPEELLAKPSRYRALVEGDRATLAEIWQRPEWRKLRMEDGRLERAECARTE